MKISNRIWQGIACSGLSLGLLGGIGLPLSAHAATKGCCATSGKTAEHRQEIKALREKMLSQAKAEDTQLEKLVTELNNAPEAKKTDLEAEILTKLVAQRHEMLNDWETLHARVIQFHKEHLQASATEHAGHAAQ